MAIVKAQSPCKVRDKSRTKTAPRTLEAALAAKARRDHPANTVDLVSAEYDLTNGEARGLVAGIASRGTINKAIRSGGYRLCLALIADVLGMTLDQFVEIEAGRLSHEREKLEEQRQHMLRLGAHIGSDPDLGLRRSGGMDRNLGR
jgi:hypothetical protein